MISINGHRIACGLVWFTTWQGIIAIIISVIATLIYAACMRYLEKKEAAKHRDGMGGML